MEVRRALVDSNTKKFRYFHKSTKKTIKHKKTLLRIKSLKIPPNYRKVKISKSPTSKVQYLLVKILKVENNISIILIL